MGTTIIRTITDSLGCGPTPTAECGAVNALLTNFYAEPIGMLHGATLWNVANTLETLTNYLFFSAADGQSPVITQRTRDAALRIAGVGTNLLTDYNDDLLW